MEETKRVVNLSGIFYSLDQLANPYVANNKKQKNSKETEFDKELKREIQKLNN